MADLPYGSAFLYPARSGGKLDEISLSDSGGLAVPGAGILLGPVASRLDRVFDSAALLFYRGSGGKAIAFRSIIIRTLNVAEIKAFHIFLIYCIKLAIRYG